MKYLFLLLGTFSSYLGLLWGAPACACNDASMDFEDSSSMNLSIADASQTGLDTGTNDFSFAAWIKMESFTGNNSRIMSKGTADPAGFNFFIRSDNSLAIEYNTDPNQTILRTTPFGTNNLGTWIHVAAAVDVSGTTSTFYVNNVVSSTITVAANATAQQDNAQAFGVGGSGAANSYFDGKIDEAYVFNRIISAGEVNDLFTTQVSSTGWTRDYPHLISYWDLDNVITDVVTSTPNDLTNNNSVPFDTADVPIDACVATAASKKGGIIMFE